MSYPYKVWDGSQWILVSGSAGADGLTQDVSAEIAGAAAKTTLADADTIPLSDSAAANILKKITWANFKTAIGVLFAPLASPTFTGTVSLPSTWRINGVTITSTAAELNFVSGVTSAIQTQINAKQPLDAALTSIAGLSMVADRGLYSTAADTVALFTLTAAGRALLDDADATAQRTTLGLGTFALENTATYVETQTAFNTGTATQESTITAAKLKATILTHAPSTNVGTGTAALAFGGVGTYVWAKRGTGTTDVASGSTVAGSNLLPTGSTVSWIKDTNHDSWVVASGAALSGTWRTMGFLDYSIATSGSTLYGGTLFLRIS